MTKRDISKFKKQTLMNKEIPVLDFLYDSDTHSIYSIEKIINKKYAPVQIIEGHIDISRSKLNEWWQKRAIPSSRENIKSKLFELGLDATTELLERCFGLSLSDQYWIKDFDSNLKWSEINFFQNDFSEDIGDFLLGNNNIVSSLVSPDNSSDGVLHKKWKIINGERCLIKSGSSIYNQEPFNEVIATALYDRILKNDEFVRYSLYEGNGKYYSICSDMIDINTELIPAYAILNIKKERGNISLYEHYISCLNELGIKDARTSIDKMLICDYILSNTDRHFGNFGVIRDVNTLKYIKVAPIFDNGTSLYSRENTINIKTYTDKLNKNNPFKNTFKEQLYLVKDLSWLDINKLNGFTKDVDDILKQNIYIDKERRRAIISLIDSNIKDVVEYKNVVKNN